MKLNGINGTGSGKLGNSVFSVRNGEQIVRQYQPTVANPSTAKQVESRAKLKLMSQLAAIVAPVIAIPSDKLKTKRNLFISRNYELAGYDNNTASIYMERVQLTKSVVAFPDFEVNRTDGLHLAIHLQESALNLFDRVIYCAVVKQADGSLRLWDSILVEDAGAGGLFAGLLPYTPNAITIYGYGIRANSDTSKAAFNSIKAPNAGEIAKILATRSDVYAATTISETKGVFLEAGVNEAVSTPSNVARVILSVQGSGQVSGAGDYDLGEEVTITATPIEGASFLRWVDADGNTYSTQQSLTFAIQENMTLKAVFSVVQIQITASANPSSAGSVSGAGSYESGQTVTLIATPASSRNTFVNWTENGSVVSTSPNYSFTAVQSRTLVANFEGVSTD